MEHQIDNCILAAARWLHVTTAVNEMVPYNYWYCQYRDESKIQARRLTGCSHSSRFPRICLTASHSSRSLVEASSGSGLDALPSGSCQGAHRELEALTAAARYHNGDTSTNGDSASSSAVIVRLRAYLVQCEFHAFASIYRWENATHHSSRIYMSLRGWMHIQLVMGSPMVC